MNARKLNQNAGLALALDDGFTDAELIDAVSDGLQGLIDCVIAQRAQLFLAESQVEFGDAGRGLRRLGLDQIAKSLLNNPRTRSPLARRSFNVQSAFPPLVQP